MQTIKFSGAEAWQKHFTGLVRQRMNDCFKEKDISTKGNLAELGQPS